MWNISWNACSHSASQDISRLLWNAKTYKSSQPFPEPHKSTPHPPFLSFRLMLTCSDLLHLGLSSGIFLHAFQSKLYTYLWLPSCALHAQCNSCPLTGPNNISWKVQITKLLFMEFLQASSDFNTALSKYFLSITSSQIISICILSFTWETKFHNRKNQEVKVLCILTYTFVNRRQETLFWNARQQAFLEYNMLLISSWVQLLYVTYRRSQYFNFVTFWKTYSLTLYDDFVLLSEGEI
jgi:hypothetical protein